MPRFLLDEHISPDVVAAMQSLRPHIDVVSMRQWEEGQYLGADDSIVLARAYEQKLTLVTYDQKTIPPLLVYWAQRDIPHAGVVFASTHTIPTSDIGAIARALAQVWQTQGDLDWVNRVVYLTRASHE